MDFEFIIKLAFNLYIYLPVVLIIVSLFYLARKIINGNIDYFEDLNILIISLVSLPMLFICTNYIIPSILVDIKHLSTFASVFLNIIPATIVLATLSNENNNIFFNKLKTISAVYSPVVILLVIKLIS